MAEPTVATTNITTAPAALTHYFSRTSTKDLHRDAIIPRLCDRSWEADLQTNYQTKIPNPNYNVGVRARSQGTIGTPATSLTEGWASNAAWGGGADFGASGSFVALQYIDHDIASDPVEVSNVIDYRSMRRTPIDLMTRVREKQIRTINTTLEDRIVTALDAATTGNSAITQYEYGTGGAAGTIIDDDGVVGASMTNTIKAALRRYTVDMRRINAVGPTALSPIGGQLGGMWAILPPELYEIFANELEEENHYVESLNADLMQSGSVFASEAWRGMYRRVSLFDTPALPKSVNSTPGPQRKWVFYLGMPAAIAYSQVPGPVLMLDETTNQTAPFWKLNQIVDYAITIVQPELLRRVVIENE